MSSKEFFVSTSEAQANLSKIMDFMENENDQFIVTRYSKPVGIFLPFKKYKKMKNRLEKLENAPSKTINL